MKEVVKAEQNGNIFYQIIREIESIRTMFRPAPQMCDNIHPPTHDMTLNTTQSIWWRDIFIKLDLTFKFCINQIYYKLFVYLNRQNKADALWMWRRQRLWCDLAGAGLTERLRSQCRNLGGDERWEVREEPSKNYDGIIIETSSKLENRLRKK